MIKNKRNLLTLILSVLCAALVALGVSFLSPFAKTASAKAPADSSKIIGEIAPGAAGFSGSNLTQLYSMICSGGTTKANSKNVNDVTAYLEEKGTANKRTYVETKMIRYKHGDYSGDNGVDLGDIVVTFGGITWHAVYLTYDRNGDTVLTLFQCDPLDEVGRVQFSKGTYGGDSNIRPSGYYGTSYMRSVVLGNGGMYYDYSDLSSAEREGTEQAESSAYYEFAHGKYSKFLDAPALIDYQETEGEGRGAGYRNTNYPGTAYGDKETILATCTDSSFCYGDNTFLDGYNTWKDDKIWLPSWAETGDTNYCNGSIWGVRGADPDMMDSSKYDAIFQRTSQDGGLQCIGILYGSGAIPSSGPSSASEFYVRPAVHLNLNSLGLASPQTVEAEYNAQPQTLATLADAGNAPGWYSAAFYTDPTKVKVTYDNANMVDAGEYSASVEIVCSLDELKWAEDATATGDTATLRHFKFRITKKPLKVSFTPDADGYPTVAFADVSQIDMRDGTSGTDAKYPKLGLKYYKKGTSAAGATAEFPAAKGTYIAVAYVTNDCNYCVQEKDKADTAYSNELEFEVTKKPLQKPAIDGRNSYEYDGTKKSFLISNVDATLISYSTPVGTEITADAATKKLTVKAANAGTYEIRFGLKNKDLYKWSGTESSDDVTLQLKITPKELYINLRQPAECAGDWAWEADTEVEFVIEPDNAVAGDKLTFEVSYTGVVSGSPTAVYDSDTGKSTVSVSPLDQGAYSLSIKLSASGDNMNANYTFAEKTQAFTVIAPSADFDATKLIWQYTLDGKTTKVSASDLNEDGVLELPYKDKDYIFTVDTERFPRYHVKVKAYADDTTGKNVAEYSVKVTIAAASEDYIYADTDFTLKYKIVKAAIDTSGFTWVWQYAGDEAGKWTEYDKKVPETSSKQVILKLKEDVNGELANLGLTVSYTGNQKKDNGDGYVAEARFALQATHSQNYIKPDNISFNWKITKKIIKVEWEYDTTVTYETTNPAMQEYVGNDYVLTQLRYDDPNYAAKVVYTYTCEIDGEVITGQGMDTLVKITEMAREANKKVNVKVKVALVDDPDVEKNYELEGTPDENGEYTESFEIGFDKDLAKVTLTAEGEYGSFIFDVKVTGNSVEADMFGYKIYKGTNLTNPDAPENELITDFDPKTADAGDYFIYVYPTAEWVAEGYTLSGAKKPFTIAKKQIAVPVVGEDLTFTGYDINLVEGFGDEIKQYIADGIISVTGGAVYRNAGEYNAYLTILNPNYEWVIAATPETPVKATAKYSLAGEPVIFDNALTLPWTIQRAKLSGSWNLKGKDGATINALSAWQEKINAGEVDIGVQYRYYDSNRTLLEEVTFKAGESFFVDAYLTGEDAANFEFESGVGEAKSATAMVEYKVPKNGVAALAGTVKDFVTKTWMGLPIWVWMLIALAVLILLIIIIAVACKRRKTKEEKAEKKAAKEEEKQRREEERRLKEEQREEEKRRREEEREAAKAKQEAELELARAKQEAELAKIKAEAAAAAAVPAVAATAAMAAQPQAQQQPMPQQMPQQQPYYPPQQMPQMPQMPQYQQPMPMQQSGGDSELKELKSEIANMRAEQRADRELAAMRKEMELGFAKFRNDVQPNGAYNGGYAPVQNIQQPVQTGTAGGNADMLGAVLASMVRNLAAGQPLTMPKEELPHSTEESSATASAPTVYPPDAVITTTTRVDTTKPVKGKAVKRGGESGGLFDVDGFYDTFDGK